MNGSGIKPARLRPDWKGREEEGNRGEVLGLRLASKPKSVTREPLGFGSSA